MAANPSGVEGVIGNSLTKIAATGYSESDLRGLAELLDQNIRSGHDIPTCFNGNTLSRLIAQCYRAMLSASPPSPPAVWWGEDRASISQSAATGVPIAPAATDAEPSALYPAIVEVAPRAPLSEPSAAWRPEVRRFADLMERELRANDFKGGWKNELPGDPFEHLQEEVQELSDALTQLAKQRNWGDAALYLDSSIRNVAEEAADVANMAMMIVDVCGALWVRP